MKYSLYFHVYYIMSNDETRRGYSHILKYTSIFGGVQGLSILVSVVRTKLVAILLGIGGVGLISIFNSTIRLLGDATNLGIPTSAVREVSEAYAKGDEETLRDKIRLVRSWSVLTAILGTFLCACLAPLLDKWTFSWGNHTLHFLFLSPTVGITAIAGCELAILKGCRQLRRLAEISVLNVIAALITSIPLYYIWGETSIVPSLFVIALTQLLLVIVYSARRFPYNVSLSKQSLGKGVSMVTVGLAFVLAGVMGSGADFLIRSYMNNVDDLGMVGLYNAGFMMTMTYSGMVFTAMDTDYFPRLSAVKGIGQQLNDMVNKQIEVCLLLVSPMLVAFMVGLPVLIPLFYSNDFLPVIGMTQVTMLAMYIRAIELPVAFIALAKGDSKPYLLTEAVYDILLVILVLLCYNQWGLTGAGWGIALTGIIDIIFLLLFVRYKYKYSLSRGVWTYVLLQVPLGIATYFIINNTEGFAYWVTGSMMILVSLGISVHLLHSKTRLWEALKNKVSSKFFRKKEENI